MSPGEVSAPRAPTRAVHAAFEGVVPPTLGEVGVFAAGQRVLVSRRARVVGYAERGKPVVFDPGSRLSAGLPAGEGDAPLLVTGRYPDLLAIAGHHDGSGGAAAYFAFVWRGHSWVKASSVAFDRPLGSAPVGAGFVVLQPDSFYLENGMLLLVHGKPSYPCDATPERPFGTSIEGAGQLVARPGFFPMSLGSDGAGKAMAWGHLACQPGVHAGRLEGASRLVLEPLPGTESCTDVDPMNGLTLAAAQLFPADDGGAYALVWPSVRDDERGAPYLEPNADAGPSKPCMDAPLRLKRASAGGWARFGVALPVTSREAARTMGESAIDPAGTAFLLTRRGTVLRVTAEGAVDELGLAPSCLAPPQPGSDGGEPEEPDDSLDLEPTVERVVAPFPDDVWIIVSVNHGSREALCRAADAFPG